jgi:3-oxoacyl-[acyl-carrier protein] reductase
VDPGVSGEHAGRTALVTGAARGLGRALAERLAAEGAVVAIVDALPAGHVVDAIRAAGGAAFAVEAKIGTPGSLEAIVAALDDGHGSGRTLDILINNVGGGEYESFADTTEAYLDHVWALNVRTTFLLTQGLLPRLSDGARIVNLSSAGARLALPETMVYSMCKAAIENLTRSLAKALGPRGITVNAIAPGLTDVETNAETLKDPATTQFFIDNTALRRVGAAQDVADVAYALTLPATRWVTGQTVDASGGFLL